ncbi:MAG: hypothetical protein GWO30_07305 [Gammaproteobacteria bacterium]|nr:hypothetical protein [Gammaproteobacteria bacterium]NIR49569.1 hypothetical protein [candidate division KSB1 bacterium]NIV70135.1 hypothetical protein [Phycisphaerae bacterium]NIS24863.1 hypothetical protein [candidate division KSB1 bacterium]NIU25499.1 hypothetical protein [candidate division KSB1 bacterium]
MSINWLLLGGHQAQKREVITEEKLQSQEVVEECYCLNGHSILTDKAEFQGKPGLTLKLKVSTEEGLLVISPFIGDHDRTFIDFNKHVGEIVEICCPTCSEPFPVYNVCPCGAHLVALFTSPKAQFSQCIGICQRLGCLHSELLSERDLRLYSRQSYF